MTIIQARPGWYAAWVDGHWGGVSRYPVVAWEYDDECEARPLILWNAIRYHHMNVVTAEWAEQEGFVRGIFAGVFHDKHHPESADQLEKAEAEADAEEAEPDAAV